MWSADYASYCMELSVMIPRHEAQYNSRFCEWAVGQLQVPGSISQPRMITVMWDEQHVFEFVLVSMGGFF